MRRTRLKILPSKCVATLGFTLLLLACPTIAEENVRPTGFGGTEPSATHVHARIKNVPPELIAICDKGGSFTGAAVSPQNRVNSGDPPLALDPQCQPNEDQLTPASKSSSRRLGGNSGTTFCDASGDGSLAGRGSLWRRQTERRINHIDRQNRGASKDVRRRRNNPLSVTPTGQRAGSRSSEFDIQQQLLQRDHDESRLTRRLNGVHKLERASSLGNKLSSDRENFKRSERLAEMNDRVSIHRAYTTDRRMRRSLRSARAAEALILRGTQDKRIKSEGRALYRSENDAVSHRRLDVSLRREQLSVLATSRRNERVNERKLTSLAAERGEINRRGAESEGSRNGRRSSDLNNARVMQQSRYSRKEAATHFGKSEIQVEETDLKRKERSVTRVGLFEHRKSALDRESSASERSNRISRFIPEVRSNILDTNRRSVLEDSRRLGTRYVQGVRGSSDERILRRSTLAFEKFDDRRDAVRSPESFTSARRADRTSSIGQVPERRSPLIANNFAAGRTARGKRYNPNVLFNILDASRRSFSVDSRRISSGLVQGNSDQPVRSAREAGFGRMDAYRSRDNERKLLKRDGTISTSRDQEMSIRAISSPMQRRERTNVSSRFSKLRIVRSERESLEGYHERRDTLRRVDSDRQVRSTFRIDHTSENLPATIARGTLSVDRVTRQRSSPETRSSAHDASRRSLLTESRRVNGRFVREDANQPPEFRRNARFDISRARSDSDESREKMRENFAPKIQESNIRLYSPALKEQERDTERIFRRSAYLRMARTVRDSTGIYHSQRESFRSGDKLGSDRTRRSSSSVFVADGPSSLKVTDSTPMDGIVGKIASNSEVLSNNRDDSRQSLSTDFRRLASWFVRDNTYHVSRAERNSRFNRNDISRFRDGERTSSGRIEIISVSRERKMTDRIASPVQRRERASMQTPGRSAELLLVRAMRMSHRYSDRTDTRRDFASVESERRVSRPSRTNELYERHSRKLFLISTAAERSVRITRTTPASQSYNMDSSRLPVSVETRRGSASIALDNADKAINVRRDAGFDGIDIFRSRVGKRVPDFRDRKMNARDASPEIQRRDYARARISSESQIVRTKRNVPGSYSENRNNRRLSESLISNGRVHSVSSGEPSSEHRLLMIDIYPKVLDDSGLRVNTFSRVRLNRREPSFRRSEVLAERRSRSTTSLYDLPIRRSPVNRRDLSARGETARRIRSISIDRSDIRNVYSQAFLRSEDVRMTKSRPILGNIDRTPNVGRDSRFLTVIDSQAKDNEKTSATRSAAIKLSWDNRLDMRSSYETFQRSDRNSPPASRRFVEDRSTRIARAAVENNFLMRDTRRRSETLSVGRKEQNPQRNFNGVERRSPASVYESSSMSRVSKRWDHSPSVRYVSDDSRRLYLNSGNARRLDARFMAKESYASLDQKRDARFFGLEVSGSQRKRGVLNHESVRVNPLNSQQLHSRINHSPQLHRERDSALADRRSVEEWTVKTLRSSIERSSEPSNVLRRSEPLALGWRVGVTSCKHELSDRRSRSLSSESLNFKNLRRQRLSSDRLQVRSWRSLSADSRDAIIRFDREDKHETIVAGSDARFERIGISRSRGLERRSIDESKRTGFTLKQSRRNRVNSLQIQRRESYSALLLRRSFDTSLVGAERNAQRHFDRRDTLRRSQSFESDRRVLISYGIDHVTERRLPSITVGPFNMGRVARRRYVPETRSSIRDASRRSLWEDSGRMTARFAPEDANRALDVERNIRLDNSRNNGGERTFEERSITMAVSRSQPSHSGAGSRPLAVRERSSGRESRTFSEFERTTNVRAASGRYPGQRNSFRRSESLESERRIWHAARIDSLTGSRLQRLLRDSTAAEMSTRRTSSMNHIRIDIGGSRRLSDLNSMKSRYTFSRSMALELAALPNMLRDSRVSRTPDSERAPLRKLSPSAVSRNERSSIRTTTSAIQRQEPDLATLVSRSAELLPFRRTLERNVELLDILRRSTRQDALTRVEADRRVHSISRAHQVFGRRSPALSHEFTAEKRADRRFQLSSSDRLFARGITRSVLGGDMKSVRVTDSIHRESRRITRYSFPERPMKTISLFELSLEGGVRLKTRDNSAAESMIRGTSPLTGENLKRQLLSTRFDLKSGHLNKLYSSFTAQQRKGALSNHNTRRDLRDLMLISRIPRTGMHESGNKLAGRRINLRSMTMMMQRFAQEASGEARTVKTFARNTDDKSRTRKGDESSSDSGRMVFRYHTSPREQRDSETTRMFRRVPDVSRDYKSSLIHLSRRSETRAVRRALKFSPQTLSLARYSRETRENMKLDHALDAASPTFENQSWASIFINYVVNYFSASLIPAIKSVATSATTLASISLPDLNVNAIMFSNEFVSTDNEQKLLSDVSSLRDMPLPEIFSSEGKVMALNLKNMDYLGEGKYYRGVMHEEGYNIWTSEESDDPNSIKILHPKLTKDNNFLSITVGGCVAALAMSVSTK